MHVFSHSHIITASGVAVACVLVLDLARRYLKDARLWSSYPLPPGPYGLPFIGVIGVDRNTPWLTYAEWAKKYGDLIYTRILGRDIIIINSEVIAKELLENRSRNYSDRPYLITRDACGREFSTIFMQYGDKWRLHRRFFHQTFRSEAVHRLLDSPDAFCEHILEYTTSIVLKSVYDYDVQSKRDELVGVVARTVKITGQALRPEISILVGAFPALLKFPSWFPGMSFKRDMATAKAYSKQYVRKPFEFSLKRLSAGSSASTMVFDALRNAEERGTSTDAGWIEDLSEAAATAFIAASETVGDNLDFIRAFPSPLLKRGGQSNSFILSFLLMMVVNPTAQKKAQTQIDAVVSRNRLPGVEDRPLLPYVDAILRETFRYCPVVPLSIPHAVVDDDVYAGFHIPKGAIILSNLWSMAHNESKYPNPHEFIPERFLDEDGALNSDDVENIAFGFGRRICVGRYFADTSVWSVAVKVLATFTIEKARDANGVEIPVEPRYSDGVTVRPLPFQCSIVPRRPGMDAEMLAELIEASTA